ncbi:MAG TPA: hypothetical protein VEL28_14785 [Candidatus Binatia bacterium]|nr:hypothetical protein [Candidatus Binatia bacterium]
MSPRDFGKWVIKTLELGAAAAFASMVLYGIWWWHQVEVTRLTTDRHEEVIKTIPELREEMKTSNAVVTGKLDTIEKNLTGLDGKVDGLTQSLINRRADAPASSKQPVLSKAPPAKPATPVTRLPRVPVWLQPWKWDDGKKG